MNLVAGRLVAEIDGYPDAVGPVVLTLMDVVAVEGDDVARPVVSCEPFRARRHVHAGAAGTVGGFRGKEPRLVQAARHRQSAEFSRTVAQRDPSRPRVRRAADVDEILMGRRGELTRVREDCPADVPAVGERRLAEQFGEQVEQRRVLGQCVEGPAGLEFEIERTLPVIALQHHQSRSSHTLVDRRGIIQPVVSLAASQDFAPDRPHGGRVEQPAEEEKTVFGSDGTQFGRVV